MNETIAATLMFQGTSSDVGKSVLTAAMCRILTQDGWKTAPFKSQNMSLNSYVTPDGKEIGRAQGMQADACGIVATTDMNPILLKPKKDSVSQVVVHGKPLADYDARTYREQYLPQAEVLVKEALGRLRADYDVVVIEGAGSPAEINLKDRDIVNMRLAGWADAPVILVADIDRGGVFASIVGTMEILLPEERERVAGFIINKFRGDVTLLKPGLDWLEERTGKLVLGVIPYLSNLELEDEDSASLDRKLKQPPLLQPGQLDIAVLRLPRMSNFTDFDPLHLEEDVRLRYISNMQEWGQPDALILPGSKNTIDDLIYLRESGLEQRLHTYVHSEDGTLLGICAGYQMMGTLLKDPQLVESMLPELTGMGYFPAVTEFTQDKRTVRVKGFFEKGPEPLAVEGYEIHMGRTTFTEPVSELFRLCATESDDSADYHLDGAVTMGGRVSGTYLHGVLHNDSYRRDWLNALRRRRDMEPLQQQLFYRQRREAAFDRLAGHVREHIDMVQVMQLITRQSKKGELQI
jgi:cobyric acid synthase CobQ